MHNIIFCFPAFKGLQQFRAEEENKTILLKYMKSLKSYYLEMKPSTKKIMFRGYFFNSFDVRKIGENIPAK